MLSELTDLKLQAAALELELQQRTGQAPPPGEVSAAYYARLAGLSEATILKVQRIGIAKIAARLLQDPELSPHLARKISRALNS